MAPTAGYGYLATAAHFAAESSMGTGVQVCTIDDSTKSVDVLVHHIDPENAETKIAYPCLLLDRHTTDGLALASSFSMLSIGNYRGIGGVEAGMVVDLFLPPSFLRLPDGPSCNITNVWGILGRSTAIGSHV